MISISLAAALAHLRLEPNYPADQIQPYLSAAELAVAQFMNRRVYADQFALDAAIAAVPAVLGAAGVTFAAAIAAAATFADPVVRRAALYFADSQYAAAQNVSRETYGGVVLDELIGAAILLILGHLFENRETVVIGVTAVEIPLGARALIQSYRIDMGV